MLGSIVFHKHIFFGLCKIYHGSRLLLLFFPDDVHDDYEFVDEEEEEETREPTKSACQRVKWNTKEEEEIKLYFKDNFETRPTPGKLECELALYKSKSNKGVLHSRNWETLKKKVWNMIKKC